MNSTRPPFRRHATEELVARRPSADEREGSRLPVIVVLDNVRSAFNVGLVFRLCDGVNIRALWLTGITPYPGVSEHVDNHLRKTAVGGSLAALPWRHVREVAPELGRLRAEGWHVMVLEQGEPSRDWRTIQAYPLPLVVVFGHERKGVADPILTLADTVVELPMRGATNSLNVALCTSAVLYDILKRQDMTFGSA